MNKKILWIRLAGILFLTAVAAGGFSGSRVQICEYENRICLSRESMDMTRYEENLALYTETQIRDLSRALNVPENVAVTGIDAGNVYYWEGAGLNAQSIGLYSNTEFIAGSDVSPDTLEPLRSIYSYDAGSVDQSKLARYAEYAGHKEIVEDLAFLINRPFWEAEGIFPDLVLESGTKGNNFPCFYSNGYVGFEAAGGNVTDPIQRIRVYGKDSIYKVWGFKPGDPWEAPRSTGYEEGGSSEYIDMHGNVLVMLHSLDETDPYIEFHSRDLKF